MLLAALCVCALSCKSKSSAELATEILLQRGTGAVMVTFPKPAFFERDKWMAQVELNGTEGLELLPRMPFSDSQSIVVLNVPVGTYSGTAVSFIRGRPPVFGGYMDSIVVKAGEITIFHGKNIADDRYPFMATPISASGMAVWSLKDANLLQPYIAQIAAQSARG